MQVHEIGHYDKCVIGQWLYGAGQEFAHLEAFQCIVVFHKKVHDLAAQAWLANSKSDHDLVEDLLTQLDDFKYQMFMAWADLNAVIGSHD
ncbi:CZB domain-containing protein [Pseudomonadota bacterium]